MKRKPCSDCPYRKDAPLELWHRSEFENLLEQEADPLNGGIFACHKGRFKPVEERTLCIGWVLSQRERGVPSIQFRLRLLKDEEAIRVLEEASDEEVELYSSIEEMCEANGVKTSRSNK